MKWIIALLLFLCSYAAGAQHIVSGVITDTEQEKLTGATVVVLSVADSSMVAFAISDESGGYEMRIEDSGAYILQVSFVSFATQYRDVKIKGEKRITLDDVVLSPQSEVLQEVTVKAEHIPMGVLGDTINYNPAAFKTKPGATVEDLLKKLPGMEVQRDGNIKAMGKDVKNVLVGGKEFFGSDPRMATKNLEAEAVEKVQLYDKKSEVAEFTGVDDGVEETTINLELKEEYKVGGFGTVQAEGGTEDRYRGKVNYNRFSPNMQSSIIVGANNVNQQPFSFGEYVGFMGGIGAAMSSSSSFFDFQGFGSNYRPRGFTDNLSTGVNFNYDFPGKLKLRSHYYLSRKDSRLNEDVFQQRLTTAKSIDQYDTTRTRDLSLSQNAKVKIEYKINPTFKVSLDNRLGFNNSSQDVRGSSMSFVQQDLLNSNQRLSNSEKDALNYDGTLNIRKKYKRKGRSWLSKVTYKNGTAENGLELDNALMLGAQESILRQTQDYDYSFDRFGLSTNYTEPVGKHYLTLAYNMDRHNESPARAYYDVLNQVSAIDDQLSASYDKLDAVQRASAKIRRNGKKYKYEFGLLSQWTSQEGWQFDYQNENQRNHYQNKRHHWLPSASLEFDLSKSTDLSLRYTTRIGLPSLQQLMPFVDNINPSLIRFGNPQLVPEYNHNINLSFSDYDQFEFTNFFLNATYTSVNDKIISERMIDDAGVQTVRPINSDGFSQLSGRTSYSAPIRALKLKYRVNANFTGQYYTTYINSAQSDVTTNTVNTGFTLSNRNTDYVDVSVGVDMNYQWTKYQLDANFDQSFFNYKTFVDAYFYPNDKWTFTASVDHHRYSSASFSGNQNYNIVKAGIERYWNEGRWTIMLQVHDLLNQNVGLSRRGTSLGLIESRYNTLGRYFLLGLKYKLGKRKNDSGIQIGL